VGQLTVRKVDDEIVRRFKIRAAERREILKQALLPGGTLRPFSMVEEDKVFHWARYAAP
jgi:plasmid stability protein